MIAVVSDVHGNYPALLSVLEEIDVIGCEQIFSLGDVSGYYCMINQCMDALRSRNVTHLLGNHDAHLVSGTRFTRSNSANRCLEYQNQVVTEENRKWLASSPLRLDSDGLSLVHGGWNDPLDEYLYDVTEEYFAGRHGRFFMSGHTHIQITKRFGEISYCNPGSVGQPRDGDPRAAFAVLDQGGFMLKRVEYDISSIAAEMERAGFEMYFYQNLYSGSRIGGTVESPVKGSVGSRQ
jgi:predicted phosphodiesterase